MGLRIVLFAAAVLSLAGCSIAVSPPPEPTAADEEQLEVLRLDAVWDETGLDDALRSDVPPAGSLELDTIGFVFAGCMEDRGWSAYSADENSASYRSLSEATSDEERLDWYECFAANPMSAAGSLKSVEQYDYVYDYFQEVLIPCLQEYGYDVSHAPSRNEFRTNTGVDGFLFAPILWNPYYALPEFSSTGSLPVQARCPAVPPHQEFYLFQ